MTVTSLLTSFLCLLAVVSASWYGIAIVGQYDNDGQVYQPGIQVFTKADDFGFNKKYERPATTACACKLYTSGGGYYYTYLDNVVWSDPRTDQSGFLVHMTSQRWIHSMSCLNDDTLVLCGGQNASGHLNSCELCHMGHPLCMPMYQLMPYTVANHAAVVHQGHLYIIGGLANNSSSSQLLDFDVNTGSWTQRTSMGTQRPNQPGAVALNDGEILVCGGDVNINSCESYNPHNNQWWQRRSMNKPRVYLTLVRYDTRVYAVGGDTDNDLTVEMYDEQYDVWTIENLRVRPNFVYDDVAAIERGCVG